jgi:hypothetical protein
MIPSISVVLVVMSPFSPLILFIQLPFILRLARGLPVLSFCYSDHLFYLLSHYFALIFIVSFLLLIWVTLFIFL